jgi:hypothetical protein
MACVDLSNGTFLGCGVEQQSFSKNSNKYIEYEKVLTNLVLLLLLHLELLLLEGLLLNEVIRKLAGGRGADARLVDDPLVGLLSALGEQLASY